MERRIERVNEAQKAAGKRATRKDAVVMADVENEKREKRERETGKTGTRNGKIIGNHRETSRCFSGNIPD